MFNVILESFSTLASKWPVAQKRLTYSEIWNSRKVVTCIMGTFDLLVFKVFFVLFGAIGSKWSVSRKRLIVERME